jgi:hypothetical protein
VSRLSLAACVLAIVPAASFADNPKFSESPGGNKPAKFDVKPAEFVTPTPALGPAVVWPAPEMPAGYQYYGLHLRWQLWADEHNCAPDGCPKPIGCGNFWTEKKFIFGSCRQFFGTAQSSIGHGYETDIRHK